MPLEIGRDTVVDAMADVSRRMTPRLKVFCIAAERTEKGVEFSSASNLTPAEMIWLLDAFLTNLKRQQPPMTAEATAAAKNQGGTDADTGAQGG